MPLLFLFFFFSEWMELLHWNLRQVRSRIRVLLSVFHSGELQMQKLRSHLLRTQSSKVLLLKPGVGQNRSMRVSSTARDFFLKLISTLPVHSTAFFQNLSQVFPVLSVANMGSCEGLQNKTDNPVFVLLYLSLGLQSKIVSIILTLKDRLVYFMKY